MQTSREISRISWFSLTFGTILSFIKFNNFGTRHLNGPRHLFLSCCSTTRHIFAPLCVFEPGFNMDKYGTIDKEKFTGLNVHFFNPIEVFTEILSRCFGQKSLLFSTIKERHLYSWENFRSTLENREKWKTRMFSPVNLSQYTVEISNYGWKLANGWLLFWTLKVWNVKFVLTTCTELKETLVAKWHAIVLVTKRLINW